MSLVLGAPPDGIEFIESSSASSSLTGRENMNTQSIIIAVLLLVTTAMLAPRESLADDPPIVLPTIVVTVELDSGSTMVCSGSTSCQSILGTALWQDVLAQAYAEFGNDDGRGDGPIYIVIYDIPENYGCNVQGSIHLAAAAFQLNLMGSALQQAAFLASVEANDNQWEYEWPDGTTGTYSVGLPYSTVPLTAELSCS